MAAIAYPVARPRVATGRSLPSEPARPARPARPALPDQPGSRVYRRRRVSVVALAAPALVAAAATLLALVGPGGGALTTSGSSGATSPQPVVAEVYVVQPGDTLWSIAHAAVRHGDPRPEVDQLASQLQGRPLQPGQRLLIP